MCGGRENGALQDAFVITQRDSCSGESVKWVDHDEAVSVFVLKQC
jgi:hypothetical protein